MDRLKQLTMDSGDPVNEEIELNGTLAHANPIAVNTPVEAAIAGKSADEDTFKFAAPPPPRDVLAIRVSGAAPNFIPGLRVYDVNHQMIERSNAERAPGGAPLTQFLSPQPNSLFYLQVFGVKR